MTGDELQFLRGCFSQMDVHPGARVSDLFTRDDMRRLEGIVKGLRPTQIITPVLREYTFDVTMIAAIRVKATSQREARDMLREHVDGADANLGAWPDGTPILCEVSVEGDADLAEVNGEPV